MEEITRYKRGNTRLSDNKVFWAYHKDYANNEMWVTLEKYLELKEFYKNREHREDFKEKSKARYYKNKEKRNLYSNNYAKTIDPLKKLFFSAKASTKSKRYGFNLKLEDLKELWEKQNGLCYYTNIPMLYENLTRSPYQVSIDRINSNIPYTKENIVLCCISINYAKNNYNLEVFLEFLNNIKNK